MPRKRFPFPFTTEPFTVAPLWITTTSPILTSSAARKVSSEPSSASFRTSSAKAMLKAMPSPTFTVTGGAAIISVFGGLGGSGTGGSDGGAAIDPADGLAAVTGSGGGAIFCGTSGEAPAGAGVDAGATAVSGAVSGTAVGGAGCGTGALALAGAGTGACERDRANHTTEEAANKTATHEPPMKIGR